MPREYGSQDSGSRVSRPKTREQDTVAAIVGYLRLRGYCAWRMNTGTFTATYAGQRRFHRFGVKGMADIIGCVPTGQPQGVLVCAPIDGGSVLPRGTDGRYMLGRFLAIEVKRKGRIPTAEQLAFLQAVTRAGGLAFVAHTLDDVKGQGL